LKPVGADSCRNRDTDIARVAVQTQRQFWTPPDIDMSGKYGMSYDEGMARETWRNIVGWPDYAVADRGRVILLKWGKVLVMI
jgi:hypothetical protein